ncbi:MAG: hypothetical protein Kow006_04880 [Gammaproteobacteria bacterium]
METACAFRWWVALAVGVRLLMAAWLPVTGDEAYFFLWAEHPDYGYYDHPPMVAWWLWALKSIGSSEWILRLPAVAVPLLVAWLLYRFIQPYGVERARLLALLFLFLPLTLVAPITTTDTPLILFSFLSILALGHAWRVDSQPWYAVAGLLLGLAFLSKYFAVLLGLAYLTAFLFTAEGRRRWKGLLVLVLAAAPAVLVNVAWNYSHCWSNILFNLFNRNVESGFSIDKPLLYLLVHLYLLTPPVVYYLFRNRRELRRRMGESEFRIAAFSAWVPLLVLGAIALRREVGLHWVLAFYPPLFLLVGIALRITQLRKATRFMIGFAGLHLVAVIALLTLPTTVWREAKLYDDIVFLKHSDEVAMAVSEVAGDLPLFTTSYTPSAILAHRLGRPVGVMGVGSRYARQDDILTDFRQLEGKAVAILVKADQELADFDDDFERLETQPIEVRGARFLLVKGYSFDLAAYRRRVLAVVRDRCYRIPGFLPAGRCGFLERYFPATETGRE